MVFPNKCSHVIIEQVILIMKYQCTSKGFKVGVIFTVGGQFYIYVV